jgi:hypothetical protein
MTLRPDLDHQLDQHLRRTLTAVAEAVQEDSTSSPARSPRRAGGHRGLIVAAATATAIVPLAAAAVVGFGPEYVDELPPANPIISGTIGGERYWVVDGRRVPRCAGESSGIEVISESSNIVGREWNTIGYTFGGESTADGSCSPRATDQPPADTYYSDGGQEIGGGMLWVGALHPSVDQVRASFPGAAPFDADTLTHEGGTYYVLEVPPGTGTFQVEYLVDGDLVVPPAGESSEHVLHDG